MLSSVAFGNGSPDQLNPGEAANLAIPVERCIDRVEHCQNGIHDLRTNPVARNQGRPGSIFH